MFTPPTIGERNIVMSVSVCLSVCLSACLSVRNHIFRTTHPIFTNFSCVLPMAVALSSSGGIVMIVSRIRGKIARTVL